MKRKRLGRAHLPRLNPVVLIGETEYAAMFQEMAAIPKAALGAHVASLAHRRADFVAAIDLLVTGS